MATVYENPNNGQRVSVGSLGPFFWCLLFGCFYFMVKGSWKHVLISFLAACVTFGISWLLYPYFAPGIIRKFYEDKGYIQVTRGVPTASSGVKKCIHCAEFIKVDAKICRFCSQSQQAGPTRQAVSGGKKKIIIKR
jgi:hypothetical protein